LSTYSRQNERHKQFAVVDVPQLRWPATLQVPAKRFRLLVAADTNLLPDEVISEFAEAALSAGMVYLCAWGNGCSRFHDIVDKVLVKDDLGERRFSGPDSDDVIMTTWHDDEPFEETLDYLACCAVPTDGFVEESNFRLVITVAHPEWAAQARQFLTSASSIV